MIPLPVKLLSGGAKWGWLAQIPRFGSKEWQSQNCRLNSCSLEKGYGNLKIPARLRSDLEIGRSEVAIEI